MAIAEIAHPEGILKAAEIRDSGNPIIPFTDTSARNLARLYATNKDLSNNVYHGSDAYRLGELEIQGQVLIMLGQEHLLQMTELNPPLHELKPIARGHVEMLVGSYKVAKQYCLAVELQQTEVDSRRKPENERMRGRMNTLADILADLGQRNIVRSIDLEIRRSPEFVQWDTERNARSKGQTY